MTKRNLKIYKPEDIDGLLNIDDLKLKTQKECEALLQQTKEKCLSIEQEAYNTAMQKFRSEQQTLFAETAQKIDNFFKQARQDLNNILNVVFDKLKIDENSLGFLTNLLFTEIDKLKIKNQKFVIYANQTILPHLQKFIAQEFCDLVNVHFEYDIKDELSSEECLLEATFAIVRINVNDFKDNVLKVLSSSHQLP